MVSTETLPLIVPPAEGKVLEDLVLWVLRRPSPTFLSPPAQALASILCFLFF